MNKILFADRLRKVRNNFRKLTVRKVSEKIGVPEVMIYRWESGRATPSLENLYKLLVCYRFSSVCWLLGIHNHMKDGEILSDEEQEVVDILTEALIKKHKKEIKSVRKIDNVHSTQI